MATDQKNRRPASLLLGPPFARHSLVRAAPWFFIGAVILQRAWAFAQVAREAREHGVFVCGTGQPYPETAAAVFLPG